MGLINYSSIEDGTTIDAADVNTPLTTIYDDYNGNIDSNNLADNAVTTAKITDANVTTAKIADANVTMPKISNPYKFHAWNATAQNSTPIAAPLLCDTELFDTNSNFDITTNKGRYTAPVAGFYNFGGRFKIPIGDNGFARIIIYVNGSAKSVGNIVRSGGAGTTIAVVVNTFIQLSAGDYVELYVQSSDTQAIDVNSSVENYFYGFLVSV